MPKLKDAFIHSDALKAATDDLRKKASPLAGIDAGAVALASQVERQLDPFGLRKLQAELRVNAERAIDPFGYARLHRSMAERLQAVNSLALGGSAAAAIRATSALRVDSAFRAALGGIRIEGLDALHTKVTDLFGASDVSRAIASFSRTRDQLRAVFGAAEAARWERLVTPTALSSLSVLSNDTFRERTALMTWAPDGALGSLAWLGVDEAEDAPVVEVAAVRPEPPSADGRAWRKLQIATDSAITCMGCAMPFRVDIHLWLTNEDTVFFQGELLTLCSSCSESGVELVVQPRFRVIDGERPDSEPANPIGKLSLIVDNTE